MTAPPHDWAGFASLHLDEVGVVALTDGVVAGWAAAAAVSSRRVYAGVAEVSIYVAPRCQRSGVGRVLLRALVERSEAAGLWTLQAGIFPENRASLRLHGSEGFVCVGKRERLGRMTHGALAGQWRDVVLLERRSHRVGC